MLFFTSWELRQKLGQNSAFDVHVSSTVISSRVFICRASFSSFNAYGLMSIRAETHE